MVGLSTMDILSSFSIWFIGSWAVPEETSWPWAAGNVTTCDIAGFIGLMGFQGSMFYNCALVTYYLLQLKYDWSDRRLRAFEKWLHIVPFSVALGLCFMIQATKMYGPSDIGHCSIAEPYPQGCDDLGSEVECIRGNLNKELVAFPLLLVNLICIVFVSISMYVVYKAVREIEAKAHRYSFTARFNTLEGRRRSMKRSRRVMIQGIMYSVTMLLIFLFGFIHIFYTKVTKSDDNIITGLVWVTISPLQGVFNLCIYLIPVFKKMSKKRSKRKNNKKVLVKEKTTNNILLPFSKEKDTETNSGHVEEEGKMEISAHHQSFHPVPNTGEGNGEEDQDLPHHGVTIEHNEYESDSSSSGDDYC
jgi:hypothetical protein